MRASISGSIAERVFGDPVDFFLPLFIVCYRWTGDFSQAEFDVLRTFEA
jgi:hypothetical protein